MRSMRFEAALALLLASLVAALCAWWSPGDRARLGAADVQRYVARLRGRLPAPPDEERRFVERLRAWAAADDGRPVYMLNVMRYYPQLRQVPGSESIALSPREANARYEDAVMPMLMRRGGFPVFAGESAAPRTADGRHADLVGFDGPVDRTDRVLVVRYPSRRAFLELISDPAYLKHAPDKFAAVELALVPLEAEPVPPDPRWMLAALALAAFCATGWWRTASNGVRYRRGRPGRQSAGGPEA